MTENLTSKTVRGMTWSYAATVVKVVLQVGFTAILARLLGPAAFGLVAMALVILHFGAYFARMGVGRALIQKERLTDADVRAAFTSSILLGAAFSALTYLLAPLGLWVFDAPDVVPVLRVMGLSFLLTGLSTTAASLMRRRLDFRSLAIVEVVSYVVGYGFVGLALAYRGHGAWSLVTATLSQRGLTALIAYSMTRHSLVPLFRWSVHKRLLHFGGLVSVISFLEFIGTSVDVFFIGRIWGIFLLGIYTRAFRIVNLPVQYSLTAFSQVVFPSFSRAQKDTPKLRAAYYRGLILIFMVLAPISFGMIPAARELVLTLLGEKWRSGIVILQILAIVVPFSMGTSLMGILCESTGRLRAKLLLQATHVALLVGLAIVAIPYGIEAIAMAVVSAYVVRFLAYQVLAHHVLSMAYRRILKAPLPGMMIAAATVAAIILCRAVLQELPAPALLACEIVAAGIAWGFFVFVRPPRVLRDVIDHVLSRLDDEAVGPAVLKKVLLRLRVGGLSESEARSADATEAPAGPLEAIQR